MQFFVRTSTLLTFAFLLFVTWLFGFVVPFFCLFVALCVILFFTRRLPPHFQEDLGLKEGSFYSPVNGKVVQINRRVGHDTFDELVNEIIVVSPWWREHGIYLPFKSEVFDLKNLSSTANFRYFYKGFLSESSEKKPTISLGLKGKKDIRTVIDFYRCPLGLWPQVRVIPGDKGKSQVNIGFFGLGGTTAIYLPSSCEILVKEGSDLIAGQTIMTHLNEE